LHARNVVLKASNLGIMFSNTAILGPALHLQDADAGIAFSLDLNQLTLHLLKFLA
jgi:hypothetical protein